MLDLVTIFLMTWLISLIAIWSYRKLSAWKGSGTTVVERRKRSGTMSLKPQQGYISLVKPSQRRVKTVGPRKARNVRLRNSTGAIKAPWGW